MDLNNDGFIDRLYIGDVGGQLWKFDLSAEATLTGTTTGSVNNWLGKRSSERPPPTRTAGHWRILPLPGHLRDAQRGAHGR